LRDPRVRIKKGIETVPKARVTRNRTTRNKDALRAPDGQIGRRNSRIRRRITATPARLESISHHFTHRLSMLAVG
jgi:hypothetical protein